MLYEAICEALENWKRLLRRAANLLVCPAALSTARSSPWYSRIATLFLCVSLPRYPTRVSSGPRPLRPLLLAAGRPHRGRALGRRRRAAALQRGLLRRPAVGHGRHAGPPARLRLPIIKSNRAFSTASWMVVAHERRGCRHGEAPRPRSPKFAWPPCVLGHSAPHPPPPPKCALSGPLSAPMSERQRASRRVRRCAARLLVQSPARRLALDRAARRRETTPLEQPRGRARNDRRRALGEAGHSYPPGFEPGRQEQSGVSNARLRRGPAPEQQTAVPLARGALPWVRGRVGGGVPNAGGGVPNAGGGVPNAGGGSQTPETGPKRRRRVPNAGDRSQTPETGSQGRRRGPKRPPPLRARALARTERGAASLFEEQTAADGMGWACTRERPEKNSRHPPPRAGP